MKLFSEKKRNWILLAVAFGLLASPGFAQNAPPKTKKKKPDAAQTEPKQSAEPDKALYDRAMADQKKGRYTEERLSLQTLINTYPDSEYLAKAKLAIADSYYKESGTSNLTLAINEYKDFITFFPFLDEATYAQMQVGMAHFHMMEKADRDRTEAEAAEDEFQTFLLKYPQSPLKGDSRAAVPRLLEVTERYPLYSQSDQALWMIGAIYEKAEKREVADKFYARIVRDYPGSPYNAEAKRRLMAAGVPVPQPDPAALARLQVAKQSTVTDPHPTVMRRGLAAVQSSPDVSHASKSGNPNLNPPSDIDAGEVLKPSAAGNTVGAKTVGQPGNSAAVETVPTGASAPSEDVPDAGPPATEGGVAPEGMPSAVTGRSGEIVGGSPSELPKQSKQQPATATAEAPAGAPGAAESLSAPSATGAASAPGGSGTTTPTATASGTGAATTPAAAASTACTTTNSDGSTKSDSGQPCAANPKTESTSKKKKGLHKLVPW